MSLFARARSVVPLALAFAAGAALGPVAEVGAKEDDGVAARAFFSPGGGIEPALLDAIKNARSEIVVAMFSFTSRPLAEALERAKARGIDVKVVLDRSQAFMKYGKCNDLRKAKCAVRLMTLPKSGDNQQIRFHHKFMVIDREIVTTGSFNWTSQAEDENWENELVLASRRLAKEFREEFEKAWVKADEDSRVKSEAGPADRTAPPASPATERD